MFPPEVSKTFGHEILGIVSGGTALVREAKTLLTDAARVAVLREYSVMALIAASEKWIPWTSLSATDGSAFPAGILMNDGGIAAALFTGGDYTGAIILAGSNVEVDASQLVFDTCYGGGRAALSLASVITAVSGDPQSGETALSRAGIWMRTLWAPGLLRGKGRIMTNAQLEYNLLIASEGRRAPCRRPRLRRKLNPRCRSSHRSEPADEHDRPLGRLPDGTTRTSNGCRAAQRAPASYLM